MTDDDLQRLEAELGECDLDFIGWSAKALALGYAPAFVPVSLDGDPTLCLGAWQPFPLALSSDHQDRAIAAIVFCDWAREEAVALGADLR